MIPIVPSGGSGWGIQQKPSTNDNANTQQHETQITETKTTIDTPLSTSPTFQSAWTSRVLPHQEKTQQEIVEDRRQTKPETRKGIFSIFFQLS